MLKSIVCTYPDFRMLPKGLKQLLVASENLFFSETPAAVKKSKPEGRGKPVARRGQAPSGPLFSRRREEPHAASRAFQWNYWAE